MISEVVQNHIADDLKPSFVEFCFCGNNVSGRNQSLGWIPLFRVARTTLCQIQTIVLYVRRRMNVILKKNSHGGNLCSFDFRWIYISEKRVKPLRYRNPSCLICYDTRCTLGRKVGYAYTDCYCCNKAQDSSKKKSLCDVS